MIDQRKTEEAKIENLEEQPQQLSPDQAEAAGGRFLIKYEMRPADPPVKQTVSFDPFATLAGE
jgi:hypothetical protein